MWCRELTIQCYHCYGLGSGSLAQELLYALGVAKNKQTKTLENLQYPNPEFLKNIQLLLFNFIYFGLQAIGIWQRNKVTEISVSSMSKEFSKYWLIGYYDQRRTFWEMKRAMSPPGLQSS